MKASSDLIQAWKQAPQAQVAVLVRFEGDASPCVKTINDLGMSVSYVFQLTNTIANSGPAHCVLELLEKPWVSKIEKDQKVTTC